MIIQPKLRGFICTTAHPAGCERHIWEQIMEVRKKGPFSGARKALIIGGSTGYGLAARIDCAFGMGADTLAVFYEKPALKGRTATAGWYNTAYFTQAARDAELYAGNINGDAFSDEIKKKTLGEIQKNMGKVDLVIYSLAAPRRLDPVDGRVYNSVIKPIGGAFTNKTVDIHTGAVTEIQVDPAAEEEIAATVKVMGGEDWERWIHCLKEADLLADGVTTFALSYIGPELTHAIYKDGTIGKAKDDLQASAARINEFLGEKRGRAFISVNKAVVTQASSAIPVVPLYVSLLFKVMKEKGSHEGTIQQMDRMFRELMYSGGPLPVDTQGRVRLDDWEMAPDVQQEVVRRWQLVSGENIRELGDMAGYRKDFLNLFGFEMDKVDYQADVDENQPIPGLIQ